MQTLNQSTNSSKSQNPSNFKDSSASLISIAQSDVNEVLHLFETELEGLSEPEAKRRLDKYGLNEIAREKKVAWYVQLLKTVTNPLSLRATAHVHE